jgi:hypothetical protein
MEGVGAFLRFTSSLVEILFNLKTRNAYRCQDKVHFVIFVCRVEFKVNSMKAKGYGFAPI